MREIDPLSCFYLLVGDELNTKNLLVVLECLKDCAFDSADCLHSLSLCSSRGQLWNRVDICAKVCGARINYLKLSCFLHYSLTVWCHIFTVCSQGGKVTFGNTSCTFKNKVEVIVEIG